VQTVVETVSTAAMIISTPASTFLFFTQMLPNTPSTLPSAAETPTARVNTSPSNGVSRGKMSSAMEALSVSYEL
jgi:hypothetical protein